MNDINNSTEFFTDMVNDIIDEFGMDHNDFDISADKEERILITNHAFGFMISYDPSVSKDGVLLILSIIAEPIFTHYLVKKVSEYIDYKNILINGKHYFVKSDASIAWGEDAFMAYQEEMGYEDESGFNSYEVPSDATFH
jgi:hypothetical protein